MHSALKNWKIKLFICLYVLGIGSLAQTKAEVSQFDFYNDIVTKDLNPIVDAPSKKGSHVTHYFFRGGLNCGRWNGSKPFEEYAFHNNRGDLGLLRCVTCRRSGKGLSRKKGERNIYFFSKMVDSAVPILEDFVKENIDWWNLNQLPYEKRQKYAVLYMLLVLTGDSYALEWLSKQGIELNIGFDARLQETRDWKRLQAMIAVINAPYSATSGFNRAIKYSNQRIIIHSPGEGYLRSPEEIGKKLLDKLGLYPLSDYS
jgi:hypothetical protein